MKKILYILGALIVLALVASALLPAHSHVERSAVIEAAPAAVYRYVADFRQFNRWSPWAERDPETQYEFSGPSMGAGSRMSWSSKHPEVGSGSQEVVQAEPPHTLKLKLEFGEGMGPAFASYTLEPQDKGTKIVWAFDTDLGANPLHRFFGLMMDKWVGADYEQGLANLKRLVEAEAVAAIETKELTYEVGGKKFSGFLAYPVSEESKQYPGVLLVHEWWGLNDYVRRRAQMVAEAGYVALALDMYGEHKMAHNPDDAMKLVTEATSNPEMAVARFQAALDLLKSQSQTDPERIGAMGYCFGGAIVLNMARAGMDLDGIASFHGTLQPMIPEASRSPIKGQIIAFTGADDPFVPQEQRDAFRKEMEDAKVSYELIEYPGAKHAFTVPEADGLGVQFNLPLKYDAAADADSWQRVLAFFNNVFGK
ncbi:MAG TPA: dienelactone hydrolase family protein [Gammaproteobacteria bacterium]|nr:dienelactone hydrolase family protein [Gammaproteobacteria bacterium]